jgi:hypothetical protein
MRYFPREAKVTYQSKYGKDVKEFSLLNGWQPWSPIYRTGEARQCATMDVIVMPPGEDLKKKRVSRNFI